MSRVLSIIAVAVALILAGCATPAAPEPVVRTVQVQIPVATPCLDADEAAVPAWRVTLEAVAAARGPQRLRLAVAALAEREAWAARTQPTLEACAGLGGG